MSKVPMDIIEDIFVRLPPKSLVRFRALSKPCCALIDSLDFIKSHLDLTLRTGDHRMILLRGSLHLYFADLDTLDNLSDVEHPLKRGGPTEVFGSCNGVIGLSNSETDLALYNPSIRSIHRLPASPVDLPEGSATRGYVFYGLGYDSVNDDYKVLRMVQFKRDADDELGFLFPYEVKVYSLRSDSWKRINTVPPQLQFLFYFYYHLLFRRGYGVLAANNLHWVLPRRPGLLIPNAILRFDLGSEFFENILPPESVGHGNEEVQMDVGVLDGRLCLMCNYDQTYIDVWVMEEYGVQQSWNKLFTVKWARAVKPYAFLKPLVYSKDGEKVLLETSNSKLQWFNLKTRKLTTVRIKDCPSTFSAEVVTGSLVLGCGRDRTDDKQQQQQLEDLKKSQSGKKRDDFLSQGFKLVL